MAKELNREILRPDKSEVARFQEAQIALYTWPKSEPGPIFSCTLGPWAQKLGPGPGPKFARARVRARPLRTLVGGWAGWECTAAAVVLAVAVAVVAAPPPEN